jgi:hypothetical protein
MIGHRGHNNVKMDLKNEGGRVWASLGITPQAQEIYWEYVG